MKFDIIGGSGFIGTRLVQRLIAAGHDVRIIDKAASQTFPELTATADVRMIDQLRNAMRPGSIVVNLAAEHRDDVRPPSLYHDVNVQGARNIIDVSREIGTTHILFTSSVAVYGFAPPGTGEDGAIAPFNEYGRTKHDAELLLTSWQLEQPAERMLAIIRPTVVFGEQNRGNVYNLLQQIASGKFVMVGEGKNRKSIAYVENVTAFIEHCSKFDSGISTWNYVDQPDFTMDELVRLVRRSLGRDEKIVFRLPMSAGLSIAKIFDIVSSITGRRFPISAIRVKKFCADSVYESDVRNSGFKPPIPLLIGLQNTIRHEFLEDHTDKTLFYSE
jgi:nucleoside-diphosphate-sugar epimerase